jgi:molybdopterin synthase catalytic subunit
MNSITPKPINISSVIRAVEAPDAGAINVFIGTTRNHSHGKSVLSLEYEAYVPMALKLMEQVEREAAGRWNVNKIAVVHRIGLVNVGEPSVVIAVSSAHRDEAFQASRFLIDKLKEVVPIWKRECFADGTMEWSQQQHEQQLLHTE